MSKVRPKKQDVEVEVYGSIDTLGALFVLFVGLKLTGHIDWGWLEVSIPIWLKVIGFFVTLFKTATIVRPR